MTKQVTIADVIAACAKIEKVPASDLISPKVPSPATSMREHARRQHAIAYVARHCLHMGWRQIGKALGYVTHGAPMHGAAKANHQISNEKAKPGTVGRLALDIQQRLGLLDD